MQKKQPYTLISKRLFDITLSLAILFVTLPFTTLALILIKIEQILRGRPFDPLFYSETRMSRGKPFAMLKFNIFKYEQIEEARSTGTFIHTKYFELNNGTTFIGKILRQIYMDELPQLLNVLIGDMSIIGPRPVNLVIYQELMERGITDKNHVPAGITGLFQSQKGETNRGAVALDREYADYYHSHPWYKVIYADLVIILKTIAVILKAKGI